MKPGKDELSHDQKEYFHRVLADPVRFAEYFLGVKLWAREVEILRSFQKHPRARRLKLATGSARRSRWQLPRFGG